MKPRQKVSTLLRAAVLAGGLVAWAGAQAQPTISSVYPDGTLLFQASSTLSFTATSTAGGGVTGVTVTLNGTTLNAPTATPNGPFIRYFTLAAGVTVHGNVYSVPLQGNCVYKATIVVTDAKGSTTDTVSFDTITPSYTWEGEDYDYGGGQFIDNPQIDQYAGLVAIDGVDAYNPNQGGAAYRPILTGGDTGGDLGNEVNGDIPRAQYVAGGYTDYDQGWNNGSSGLWGNYTRTYPQAPNPQNGWWIYVRAAGDAAGSVTTPSLNMFQGAPAVPGPTGTQIGQFVVPYTGGWQTYTYVPMTLPASTTMAAWYLLGPPNTETLAIETDGGNYNINFFMLLPVQTVLYPDASLGPIFPDGSYQFQATNLFAMTILSTKGVSLNNVLLQLSWHDMANTTNGSAILLPNAGLTEVSGSTATTLMLTAPLPYSNNIYTAFIEFWDYAGVLTTLSYSFDTITPSYTWEAEDYDYSGGQFIDNPQTNAYAGLVATLDVDGYNPNNPSGAAYRPTPATGASGNLGNEVNSDVPRLQYIGTGFQDYDQGWNNGGSGLWGNYTRTYPTGRWNIYGRMAGWSAQSLAAPSACLYQAPGPGQPGPNGTYLGELVVPDTANSASTYQNYTWVPMTDTVGNLLEWDGTGSPQTLAIQTVNGSYNVNFFALMPMNPNQHMLPYVNGVNPAAAKFNNQTTMFAYTNVFSFIAHSVPGIGASGIAVTLNGQPAVNMSVGSGPNTVPVSIPVAVNQAYQVTIVLTDAYGTTTYSTWFGTFKTSYYTFEAEDWDYNGGQFFDTGIDQYANLQGVSGVDGYNNQGGGDAYRATGAGSIGDLGNEDNGDTARAQYTASGATDYDVGWTAGGQWANYTRHYPAGAYNVYLRAAGNTGGANSLSLAWVTSGYGTSSQTLGPSLGNFNIPNTGGWQTYTFVPMLTTVGTVGNLAVITNTSNGGISTLQMTENGGGWNANFFLLSPVDAASPYISNIYPDGTAMFQATNQWTCVITNSVGIQLSSIVLNLNGQTIPASGLTLTPSTGTPTKVVVNYPLQLGALYSAGTISAVSINNDQTTVTVPGFATFSSSWYTWEAEDWDYNGGQFFDNPQVDDYAGLSGIVNVDGYNNQGGASAYRTAANGNGDLGNEGNGDLPRAQYTSSGKTDYDVGWTAGGQWANYTRTYPAGIYYVWTRAAINGASSDGATFSWVTSGLGTTTQTLSPAIGQFNFTPATGGWQNYTWIPLVNSAGNMVTITNSGSVATLRLTELTGGYNLNFFLLQPAAAKMSIQYVNGQVVVSWAPTGGTLWQTPVLNPSNWTRVAGAASPYTNNASGKAMYYRVSP